MLELPMPARGLDRCMTIFTWGFQVHGSHCRPHNNSWSIAGLPPPHPPTSTHIYIWKRWGTSKLSVSCSRTRCNTPTLEQKLDCLMASPVHNHSATMPTPLILRWEGVIVRSIKEWGSREKLTFRLLTCIRRVTSLNDTLRNVSYCFAVLPLLKINNEISN